MFGIARTTLILSPSFLFISVIVIPGASDITILSSVTISCIFLKPHHIPEGFTARIMYFALFAHSALLSANLTPVSSLIFSLLSLLGHVNVYLLLKMN